MWFGTEIRLLFQGSILLAQVASSSLHVLGHICLFPSQVQEHGTDAVTLVVPLKPWRKALPPFNQTGQSRAPPGMQAPFSACVVGFDGDIGKGTWVENCTDTGAPISEGRQKRRGKEARPAGLRSACFFLSVPSVAGIGLPGILGKWLAKIYEAGPGGFL